MQSLTVVVIGMPQVAEALARTGQFAAVESALSTGGLRDLLMSNRLSSQSDDKVFMFSDATPVDTPQQPLSFLVQQLTARNTRVVVVATSPAGEDLVAQNPAAGLLKGALRVNSVLGALGGMQVPVVPVSDVENLALDPSVGAGPLPAAPAPVASAPFGGAATNPFAAPAAPGPVAPAAPFATAQPPAQPPAQPFGGPVSPAPAAPAPAAPFEAPAAPAPFEAPAAPVAASPFGAPVPAAAAPFEAPAPAAPAAPFSPPTPAMPAAPFGTPVQAPAAPFTPAPSHEAAPFSTPAQAGPSPFGTPVQAAPASPFDRPPTITQPPTHLMGQSDNAFGVPVARAGMPSEAPQRLGRVISIVAPKGGVGKSSLSINLAAYMGLRTAGQRTVALIDANVQQADAGKYLQAWHPNVEDLVKDPMAMHPSRINSHLLAREDLNLSVLLGPATPDAANPVYYSGKRYAEIVEAMRPNFDYIFVDTPVAELFHQMFRDFVLPKSDYLLVAIAPNYATVMNTDAWLREITTPVQSGGSGFDPNRVGVVLNRAETDIGFEEDEVRRDLGSWRAVGAIPETKAWKAANNEGKLVATMNYAELSHAFSNVLFQATGDELLQVGSPVLQQGGSSRPSLKALMGRMKKKGGR